jgi:hypothetical protein
MDTGAIQLPPAVDGKSLVGVFIIKRHLSFDEVSLATGITLGVIHINDDTYQFQPHGQEADPIRESYEATWFDVLVMIANDKDLAIEFAVLAQKASKPKPSSSLHKAYIVNALKGI